MSLTIFGLIAVAAAVWWANSSCKLVPDLSGRIAVVTGGSRGLGRGIAMGLAEAGATVYITGRTQESLDEACVAIGNSCHARVVDSVEDTDLDLFFRELAREHGRIDILVNNAFSGLQHSRREKLLGKPFWEAPMRLFDSIFEVGVRSHYYATRLAVPLMKNGGLILNSNSPGCIIYGISVPYGMGKCAIDKMTADMSVELPENIHVISVIPGLVQTEEVLLGAVDVGVPGRGCQPGLHLLPHFSELHGTLLAGTPLFEGRTLTHLARDTQRSRYTGKAVITSQLASMYGVLDERGVRTPSLWLSFKGVVCWLVPALREFARVTVNNETNRTEATPMQRFFFNVLPDWHVPLTLMKIIGGPPLTMKLPDPRQFQLR